MLFDKVTMSMTGAAKCSASNSSTRVESRSCADAAVPPRRFRTTPKIAAKDFGGYPRLPQALQPQGEANV